MTNSTQQATELTQLAVPTGSNNFTPPRCCFCGRKIKNNPVSRFMRHGIEFLEEDEVAHKGCCFRRYEKIKEVLIKMDK